MTIGSGKVLNFYNKCLKYPFGKRIFSMGFSFAAPYFLSIWPLVENLKPGHASVSLTQSWSLQNHIKTVHAIAVCNLVEMCMGLVMEASIPKHLRWLPMGMDVDYTKKATGKLTATSNIDPEKFFVLQSYPGQVGLPVEVKDEKGVVVTKGTVRLWISKNPKFVEEEGKTSK